MQFDRVCRSAASLTLVLLSSCDSGDQQADEGEAEVTSAEESQEPWPAGQRISPDTLQALLQGLTFVDTQSADTTINGVEITETPIQNLDERTRPDLAQGKIIGRRTASGDIPSAGVRAGTWYTWIDSIGSGQWRAVQIPADSTLDSETLELRNDTVPLPEPLRVQWTIIDGLLAPWYPCPWGCCRMIYRPYEPRVSRMIHRPHEPRVG